MKLSEIKTEWDEWERNYKANQPIKYFFFETIPLKFNVFAHKLSIIKWWFKYRLLPWHRHHVIKTGLPPGYSDKREILLYVSFTILKNFIEKEKPHKFIVVRGSSSDKWREIFKLYRWWTRKRPKRVDPLDVYDGKWVGEAWDAVCEASNAFEIECFEEDQKMLHRLIEIRPFLWT